MAPSKDESKKLTDEELLAQFDTLGTDDTEAGASAPSGGAKAAASPDDDDNPFAELNAAIRQPRVSATISRPDTPTTHLAAPSSTATSVTGRGQKTPTSSGSGRSSSESEEKHDDQKILKAPAAPASASQQEDAAAAAAAAANAGASWWGGLSSIVSGARKQAEAAYKEIQGNEEAQKWAEHVKGNTLNYSTTLRSLGAAVGSRALPTFQSLLHTIAPPISQHERLAIHTTHDLQNYPSLDPLIYDTFSRVMAQVEGGDLIVIQRGSESRQNASSPAAFGAAKTISESLGFTGGPAASAGWSDGPWWRDVDSSSSAKRNVGAVKGLVEGTKLARASAESYAAEYFAAKGGLEEAAKQATQSLGETNPTRSSDIFLAIQAVSHSENIGLFQASSSEKNSDDKAENSQPAQSVSFAAYLHDPIHNITFSTLSQPIPQKWIDWLDAAPEAASPETPRFPAEIQEVVNMGGVDPREWVAEWVEEAITLAIGVVAQRYVAKRMGVGEDAGAIMKGKRKVAEIIESGGGEAARAI